MWINTVLFAAGVLACQQLQVLPHLYWSIIILLLILFMLPLALQGSDRWGLAFLLFGLGFSWAVVYGHWKLADRLEPELIRQPLVLTGSIVELPRHENKNWRFVFEPDSARLEGETVSVPSRIRLGWYKTDTQLSSAQRWQLQVKLKPATGLQNPGLFDFERWLFQRGIGARGYVVTSKNNRLLDHLMGHSVFDRLREHIRQSLTSYSEYPDAVALVLALTVGDKSYISPGSWETFRVLGINHLVAISGLHVGMIVLLTYWMAGRLWRLSVRVCEWIPAPLIQAVAGVVAAFLYAGMAGFSLPTQRAMVMISVVLLAKIFLVNLQPFRQLAIAVFVVLLWDPLAIIAPGFWLSFMAVTAIFMSIGDQSDRREKPDKNTKIQDWLVKVRQLVVMQWSITLLLLPFSLLFFNQVSVVSPLANLLLIPVFSFFIVPLSLLLTLLNQLDHGLVESLFRQYLDVVEWLLLFLEQLAVYDWFVFQTAEISLYRFAMLLLPVFVWYLGNFRFRKFLAIVILVAALFFPQAKRAENLLFVTVLDIGQGTSVLLEAAGKILLYDLGPRYGNGNSATLSVVVPFLKNRGIKSIDMLVISHSDSDHAGDLPGFLGEIHVEKLVAGERLEVFRQHDLCRSGQKWKWQQTVFEFLSPDRHPAKDNNASCVLRVEHGENHLLLTGDMEKTVERRLLKGDWQKLEAEVVLVPHHGSKSSSTPEFVKAVDARYVINTSGYLNRYGFPKEIVKNRWLKNGAEFLNTGELGALELIIGTRVNGISFQTFRQKYAKYWHWER